MTAVAPQLSLPAEVCATLMALGELPGDRPGAATAVSLGLCGAALGHLADHIRTLIAGKNASCASSVEISKKLLATLAGVEAAARIVQQEDSRR